MLLTLTLPVLMGCQMLNNRKPQSAGFRGYCSDCLIKGVAKEVENLRKIMRVDHQTPQKQMKSYYEYDREPCSVGYVEGLRYNGDTFYKECLPVSKLPIEYEVHYKGRCAEGYVEGKMFDMNGIGFNSAWKECFHVTVLPTKYEVHIGGSCKEGYVEGKKFNNDFAGSEVDSKECLDLNKLPDKYEVYAHGSCAKGYVEGKAFNNKGFKIIRGSDDYDSKECLLESKLPTKYQVYYHNDCAEGYVEGKILDNNSVFKGDDYDSKVCTKEQQSTSGNKSYFKKSKLPLHKTRQRVL